MSKCHPDRLWSPLQPCIQCVLGALSLGIRWLGQRLSTNLYIVLRLRMHGAIPSLPHTSSWCGT